MKAKFVFIIVCVQIITIVFFFFQIINKTGNTLGVSVNVINPPKSIQRIPNERLKYFYEPEALTLDIDYPIWSKEEPYIYINSDTLNSLMEYPISLEYVTVIALGDSFTYGQYVDTTDNWPSVLNSRLVSVFGNKTRVINLGEKGYDIEYAVERYRLRGQKYVPKLVVWLLKYDDFISIAEKLTPLIGEQKKIFENKEMKDKSELIIPRKGNIEPVYITRAVNIYLKQMGGVKNIYEYQKKQLRNIRRFFNGNILFVLLPGNNEQKKIIIDWSKEDKRIFLVEAPNIYGDSNLFFPDMHPSATGHRLIADFIFEYIKANPNLLK